MAHQKLPGQFELTVFQAACAMDSEPCHATSHLCEFIRLMCGTPAPILLFADGTSSGTAHQPPTAIALPGWLVQGNCFWAERHVTVLHVKKTLQTSILGHE
ncbi:hypothetical protein PGT21_027188 [Puccinia graminis f. sp. tritici]|uniref:Uncharacterized protein n=1 Tax=Puccinia graminis f. sp. tritici TaxID=56615 RepID=A0A5B0M7U2_PUCGR|nr:hypothetical protein PGT21_027188 [Puccinia graminis f. sp. tritici]KAA1135187.1 hypothetical protein PGTUg99_010103 [Puccinia graminis f. sp. tritici]